MKKLFLITQFYPFKNNEEPFILPELKRLKNEFEITVIAADMEHDFEIQLNVPADVRVMRYSPNKVKLFWIYYKRVGYKFSEICKEAKKNGEFSKRYYARGRTFEYWFSKQKFVKPKEEFIIYSYWYLWWILGFAENKSKYPNMKLITRVHGFDLYDERHRSGKQPFRNYLDSKIDKVFFVSEVGRKYYLENQASLPIKKDKYIVSYLGQEDYFDGEINKSIKEEFTIVSCSNVIPLKRVNLIAKSLREVKCEKAIKWIHFGDGPSLEDLKKEVEITLESKPNISIELKGRVKNRDVIDFYKTGVVDLFITTSSTEGLPVSISEAMCFGIPIIATNVGGISEQIDGNGLLLSANPSEYEVEEAIEKIVNMDKENLLKMGQKSREIWNEKFNIENNILTFMGALG